MTAFVRRFRDVPSLEVLTEIEQVALIDRTPRTPVVGTGSGTLMIVGEFEDGAFNTPTEVFGENHERRLFGGFGYTYGDTPYQNPSARLHLGEFWNGNGYLKGKYLRPRRKIIVRVDTSVGSVRLTPVASLRTEAGPFRITSGGTLSITTDTGGPTASDAFTGVVATEVGGAFAASGFVGGEQITIGIDDSPVVTISFQAADSTRAQVAARINAFLGYTAATDNGTGITIVGLTEGTDGQVVLDEITAGALAAIGLTAGTTAGTGNVGDTSAVTATEVANIINGTAGLTAINALSVVDGTQAILYANTGAAGTLLVAAGTLADELGITTGTTITGNIGGATSIPAGTRVRNAGADEWVTMQTIAVPAGTASVPNDGFFDVKIRPGNDVGTLSSETAGNITTLVDAPADRYFTVTNPANVSAALTENQIDVAYETAFAATVDPSKVTREVNHSLSARRSAAVIRAGQANAVEASDDGNFGRKFTTRSPIGWDSSQAIADVANYRIDRVFYAWPNWQVRIPEIAELGTAGGTGFTSDGVIDVGADGPLAYINCVINPEENPGQDTGLLSFISDIEAVPDELNRALYTALKAAGICAPRVNNAGTFVYQSEVTAELTPGRTTQKRRKMADFIQDSVAVLLLPFSKKLATDAREAGIDAVLSNFLERLQAKEAPERSRIRAFSLTNTTDADPDYAASGISARKIQVQMYNSLDTFIVDTEIGEGVVITSEV